MLTREDHAVLIETKQTEEKQIEEKTAEPVSVVAYPEELKLSYAEQLLSPTEKNAADLDLTEKKVADSELVEEKLSNDLNHFDGLTYREQNLSAISISEFKKGDILLYLPTKKMTCAQKFISFFQWLTKRKNGHYEIAHAAIFDGYHEEEKGVQVPKIIDVTGAGYSIRKLKEEQPLLVFRPLHAEIGEEIAATARGIRNNPTKPYWSCCTGIGTLFKRKKLEKNRKLSPTNKDIPTATICSQFVIKTIKKTMIEAKLPQKVKQDYYLNITSLSTPKDLEAELYENENYRMHCYLGKRNPFELIREEVENQLSRLKKQTSKASKEKYKRAVATYNRIINNELRSDNYDNLQKAIILTKLMLTPFSINTGCNFKTPTSYTGLIDFARSIGIFRRDINNFSYQKLSEVEMLKYTKLEDEKTIAALQI